MIGQSQLTLIDVHGDAGSELLTETIREYLQLQEMILENILSL